MKYTRSAAQKNQQNLQKQQQEQEKIVEKSQKTPKNENNKKSNKRNNVQNVSITTTTSKKQNNSKLKKSSTKSSNKKSKSKYCSDSDEENDYNKYYFEEEFDEDDDDEYMPVETEKNKNIDEFDELDDVEVDDVDELIDNYKYDEDDDDGNSNEDDDDYDKRSRDLHSPLSDEYYLDSQDSLTDLKIPQSSEDLLINKENLLNCLSVYEILRHFRNILRLSPFLFEDFCACLMTNENNALYSEVHIALIKALLKEDEINMVSLAPADLKTCVDLSIFLIDSYTWPDILRQYIESDTKLIDSLNKDLMLVLNKDSYPLVSIDDKLYVLNTLCNMFLSTSVARHDLLSEGNIVSDDHCRVCHKLGNLLCCETCPATYHLDCLDPPLTDVPEDDWTCYICRRHQLHGVTDCLSEVEKSGLLIRQDPLGYDRHRRKYWFLSRRIIVESENNEIFYYSTKLQLDQLIKTLDANKYEKRLVRNINELYDEIVRCMNITEELTNSLKDSKKSYLEEENNKIKKLLEESEVKKEEETQVKTEVATVISEKTETIEQNKPINGEVKKKSNDLMNEEEEECIQNRMALDENAQLDGIVDNLITDNVTSQQNKVSPQFIRILTVNSSQQSQQHKMFVNNNVSKNDEGNVIRMDLSKEDDLNSDDDVELVPSTIKTFSNVKPTITTIPKPIVSVKADEKLLEKYGIKRDGLLIPRVKITDLNNLIPDLANQKVKVVNDKGINLSSDASKTVTLQSPNKESTRFKLAILPINNEIQRENSMPRNHLINFKVKSAQLKVFNNYQDNQINQVIARTIAKETESMNQDYELGDALKFVSNIKTNLNIDGDLTPANQEITKVAKLISNETHVNISNHSVIATNMPQQPQLLYKLGMESNYRLYDNQYTSNPITMNKHQHNQERDRKNIMGRRFIVGQEYHWKGTIYAGLDILAKTLSHTLISIEGLIPIPFMHHLWPHYRDKWVQRVNTAKNVKDFSICLLVLEACMKPMLFVAAWKDSLGYLRLHRETQQEREERKKEETHFLKKRPISDDTAVVNSTNQVAHFTKGIKHQVYKQKGEEYRLHGTGGWYWCHSTRRCTTKSFKECGTAGEREEQSLNAKLKYQNLMKQHLVNRNLVDNLLNDDNTCSGLSDTTQPWFNNTLHPHLQTLNVEEFDMSENLKDTRVYYPKVMKKKAKLDQLLKRREDSNSKMVEKYNIIIKELEEKIYNDEIKQETKVDENKNLYMETNALLSDIDDIITDKSEMVKDKVQIKLKKLIEDAKITPFGERLIEYNNEIIKLPLIQNNTKYKFRLKNENSPVLQKKDKLPPYPKYSIHNKNTIFLFPREITRLIARKGGFRIDIPGFKHDNHKQSPQWPYPCSRPLLKTCWCYKTYTATNLSTLGLQLKYFWCCIRWDAINERAPQNSLFYQGGVETMLTEHLENCMQTTEIVNRRNVGIYKLRSEYLIRKKRIPYNNVVNTKKSKKDSLNTSASQSPRTPSARRSGLRQLRQSIVTSLDMDNTDSNISVTDDGSNEDFARKKEPVVHEEWIAEEFLHLWQIKSFYERSKRLEIEAIRAREKNLKLQQQKQAAAVLIAAAKQNQAAKQQTQARTVASHLNLNANKFNIISNNQHFKLNIPSSATITPTVSQHNPIQTFNTQQNKVTLTTCVVQNPTQQQPQIKSINLNLNNTGGARIVRLTNGQYVQLSIAKSTTTTTGTTTTMTTTTTNTQQILQTLKPAILSAATTPTAKCIPKPVTTVGFTNKPTILGNLTLPTVQQQQQQPQPQPQPQQLQKYTVEAKQDSPMLIQNQENLTPKPQQTPKKQEELNESVNDSARSKRRRKLPSKYSDTYELGFDFDDTGKNTVASTPTTPFTQQTPKQRVKPKSIQAIIKSNEALANHSTPQVVNNASIESMIDIDDLENRLRKKRLDVLNKKKEDLRSYIKYKRSCLDADILESIRLDIELDEYYELKKRLTPEELAATTSTSLMNEKREPTPSPPQKVEVEVAKRPSRLRKSALSPTIYEQNDSDVDVSGQVVKHDENVLKPIMTIKGTPGRKRKISSTVSITNNTNTPIIENRNAITNYDKTKRSKLNTTFDENVNLNNLNKLNDKTYCICNSPYDKKRFYIQCDACNNWYHGECVNVTPDIASKMSDYQCSKCKTGQKTSEIIEQEPKKRGRKKRSTLLNTDITNIRLTSTANDSDTQSSMMLSSNSSRKDENPIGSKEVYCLCHRSYDERLFYIGCDLCLDWFHGACVGVFQLESSFLETYTCPNCLKKDGKEWVLERKITLKNLELMKSIVQTVQNNKLAWPFLTPVDAKEVPNYYTMIKQPMDLSTVESRLNNFKYNTYVEFLHDLIQILENCRLFNAADSTFCKCADGLEKLMVDKIKLLKQKI